MRDSFHLSFWERQSYFENVDLLIIGGGIVGLNAALAVKELDRDLKVLVVDRGAFLPYGASTRNAGFACFGSMTELLDDLKRMDHTSVFALVEKRYAGLCRLRELLGDDEIGFEPLGGYEIFTSAEEADFRLCGDSIDGFNRELKRITGVDQVYSVCDERIGEFGFNKIAHLILNRGEGQIDTGKMMKALLNKVRAAGVEVLTGLEILKWEREGDFMRVNTANGFDFKAGRILVTTNAFARQLLPGEMVVPGRAQVLVTSPLKDLKVKGAFHYDKGYYYFRNVGSRVLFGGGRNLDFTTEETTRFGLTSLVQERLEVLLKEVILPDTPFEIEQRWSGIMGLGPVKTAIVKKVQDHVYCAVRMGGMGVAIGSMIGREAAEMIV